MQVPYEDTDAEADAETQAWAQYADTLVEWRKPRPVVVIGTAGGLPVARYVDELGDDPPVWAPGTQGVIFPTDPGTFLQVALSDAGEVEPVAADRTYPTVAHWYAFEIEPTIPTE